MESKSYSTEPVYQNQETSESPSITDQLDTHSKLVNSTNEQNSTTNSVRRRSLHVNVAPAQSLQQSLLAQDENTSPKARSLVLSHRSDVSSGLGEASGIQTQRSGINYEGNQEVEQEVQQRLVMASLHLASMSLKLAQLNSSQRAESKDLETTNWEALNPPLPLKIPLQPIELNRQVNEAGTHGDSNEALSKSRIDSGGSELESIIRDMRHAVSSMSRAIKGAYNKGSKDGPTTQRNNRDQSHGEGQGLDSGRSVRRSPRAGSVKQSNVDLHAPNQPQLQPSQGTTPNVVKLQKLNHRGSASNIASVTATALISNSAPPLSSAWPKESQTSNKAKMESLSSNMVGTHPITNFHPGKHMPRLEKHDTLASINEEEEVKGMTTRETREKSHVFETQKTGEPS